MARRELHSDFWTHVEDVENIGPDRAAIESRQGEYWVNVGTLNTHTIADLRSYGFYHGPYRTLEQARAAVPGIRSRFEARQTQTQS